MAHGLGGVWRWRTDIIIKVPAGAHDYSKRMAWGLTDPSLRSGLLRGWSRRLIWRFRVSKLPQWNIAVRKNVVDQVSDCTQHWFVKKTSSFFVNIGCWLGLWYSLMSLYIYDVLFCCVYIYIYFHFKYTFISADTFSNLPLLHLYPHGLLLRHKYLKKKKEIIHNQVGLAVCR